MPQSSVLGPLLFTVLVSDLGAFVERGRYHIYADDTQLYYSCKYEKIKETISNINVDLEWIMDYSKIVLFKIKRREK